MKNYLQGLLTGVAAGLLIGYLTAPNSGKKTRKKIVKVLDRQARDLTDGISDQWDRTIAMAEGVVDRVRG
ncbi:YtxH domain-containing protein [Spirosoma foliorum]|uniref:YtxH domain-containing protein n=1 Tax=Spirosoma foliorum TaxID=2710596 RepID=A0A7G5H510_9BACT|nr:YtxH domain-containing protein [Spirosoma foliorum]QMW06202.1 YtxH domain-containing protein [Spirosoma foliorum]